jgi:hypothetical protein
MADEPQGPGWWQASDGKWYPPELHPSAQQAPPPAEAPPPDPTVAQPAEPAAVPPTDPTVAQPVAPYGDPTVAQPVGAPLAGEPPFAGAPPAWAPPAEPPAKGGSRRGPLIAVAIIVLLAAVAAAVYFATKDDDNKTATIATESSSVQTDSSSSTKSSSSKYSSKSSSSKSSSSNGSSVRLTPATGPTVNAPNTGVTLTLPEGWVGTSTEEGVEGAGAAMFPNDPDLASAVESRMSVLPRAVVVFGVEEQALRAGSPFTPNLNILADPSVPSSYSLEDAGKAEARGIGSLGTVKDRKAVDLDGLQAQRIQYEASSGQFSGVAYVFKEAGKFWVLTFSFSELSSDNVALADGSASTFTAV